MKSWTILENIYLSFRLLIGLVIEQNDANLCFLNGNLRNCLFIILKQVSFLFIH